MRWLLTLSAIIVSLAVLFLVGPKVPVNTEIHQITLSNNLDDYLRKSEARFSDIRTGTEKTIVWANPLKKDKTALSIISIHGFTASRQEIFPLCDMLAQRLGANLFYTRLTGHGRTGQVLAEATVNDWLNDTVEALKIGRQIGEKVIIIGTSMGGTLAMWLATYDDSEDVLAYILLSPNFAPKDSKADILTWPWAKYFVPLIFGEDWGFNPQNSQQAKYWTTQYPTISLFPMMGLTKLVRGSNFGQVKKPFLFLFSLEDQVVNSETTMEVYERLGSKLKEKILVKDSRNPEKHVIVGDILSPENNEVVTQEVLNFLGKL
ncbi:MAG: hypothetical protein BWK78_02065 [Thiotrichaceae bacterium IS1]|nr:MAG: hypothetical protein BWK78_02065 [Thiotrichaceae bacterium IS1]